MLASSMYRVPCPNHHHYHDRFHVDRTPLVMTTLFFLGVGDADAVQHTK